MHNPRKSRQKREPRGTVVVTRSIRRDPPDLHRLARALLDLAAEQAAAETEAKAERGMKHDTA